MRDDPGSALSSGLDVLAVSDGVHECALNGHDGVPFPSRATIAQMWVMVVKVRCFWENRWTKVTQLEMMASDIPQ